ncbi:hypothetical protein JCM11251_006899 [Rhodosporidiobolus azoricus]
MPVQPVLQPSSASLPEATSLHLLPFSLAFDGPAPIDRFFHPRPYTSDTSSTSSAPPTHRQAAFRGRRVVSSLLPLPSGYKGVVLASSAPALPSAAISGAAEEAEDSAQLQEREERAAKRAKRAAESAAALGSAGDESGGSRRSPRKSVAEAARRRAVEAAKRAKGKAAKGKGKSKFSLDDDEDEDEEFAEQEKQPEEQAQEDEAGTVKVEEEPAAPGEEAMQVDVEQTITLAVKSTEISVATVAETVAQVEVVTEATDAAEPTEPSECIAAPDPPAPLLSRTSTATSSAIPSTPLTSTASIDSLSADKNPFDVSLSTSTDETTEVQRDVQVLRPVLSFSAIEIWNADFPVAGGRVEEEDDVGRAVSEWLGVAEKIHAY